MKYYPRHEIENGLTKNELTISSLSALITWMNALKKYKPTLVDMMGEDMIRKITVEKIASRKLSRDALRNTRYCEIVAKDDIQRFLTDKNMVLNDQIERLGLYTKEKEFKGHLITMGHFKKRIELINVNNEKQKQSALQSLEQIQKLISQRIESIKQA